mmetsp:Transcript_17100/g.37074  ORF Transcript_17100/g.37074 Transcript_17100/m.37074 type:complete len:317 (+) Transcript_17100:21-971(+)
MSDLDGENKLRNEELRSSTFHSPFDASSLGDDDVSIDSDNAFAYLDFSGVDFGESDEEDKTADAGVFPRDTAKTSTATDINKQRNLTQNKLIQRYNELPSGQEEHPQQSHDPKLFEEQTRRVQNLAKWFELGVRPLRYEKDDDLFQSENDDLALLLLRSIEAQDDLNANLPPHPNGKYESQLKKSPSTIEDAGNGLFAMISIPKGDVICYYTGYRHDYQSQKRLRDRSYVLKLQNGWPKHDRRNDGFVDALPCKSVLARYINDPRCEERCNVKFDHIQEPGVWHCPVIALRDIEVGEELFISYGPRYWAESRMIGG